MERTVVYPGSFDPITNGHVSVIMRGLSLFDKVVVAVTHNPNKKHLFSAAERVDLIKRCFSTLHDSPWYAVPGRMEVVTFENQLLATFAKGIGAKAILRGLRPVSDFEGEFMMAQANHSLAPDIETVFVVTQDEHYFISSSMVREIASLRGDVSKFVSPHVATALSQKFG